MRVSSPIANAFPLASALDQRSSHSFHTPFPWRWDQGADDINDLQKQEHVAALASHLRLSPIKHGKLVDALLAAGSTSPPSAPAAAHAKLTSQLADMFSALSLSNKLSTAVAWCEEQVKHATMASVQRWRLVLTSRIVLPACQQAHMASGHTTQFAPPCPLALGSGRRRHKGLAVADACGGAGVLPSPAPDQARQVR